MRRRQVRGPARNGRTMPDANPVFSRRRVTAVASKLAICGCWLLALLCVLPALVMLLGTLLKNGAPSLEHLRHAFGSPGRLLVLLGNSLAVAGATVGVALGLGAPLGFLCFRTDLPGRRAWVRLL